MPEVSFELIPTTLDCTALDYAVLHRGYENEEGHESVPRKKHRPMRLDMARH